MHYLRGRIFRYVPDWTWTKTRLSVGFRRGSMLRFLGSEPRVLGNQRSIDIPNIFWLFFFPFLFSSCSFLLVSSLSYLLVSFCHCISFVASFGSIEVAELDWGNSDHIRAVDPPFDYIIGTDIVSWDSYVLWRLLYYHCSAQYNFRVVYSTEFWL